MTQAQEFDPYVALGLAYGVTDEEIKAQYRRLVKKYHPDHNKSPNAAQKMTEVIEAYRLLSDPVKKREFDKKREEKLFGRYQQSTFFDGLKNFAARVANDFIDDVSQGMQQQSIDPTLLEISDISTRSTRSYHEIKIRIHTDVMDIWKEDKEYWIDQLCAYIERDLNNKIT